MEEMVMAGAFASWYWTFDKKDITAAPLTASFFRTFRYHLGTLAFGSLIIAIIRFIRLILEYIEQKLKEYKQDNPVVKVSEKEGCYSRLNLAFDCFFSSFSLPSCILSCMQTWYDASVHM